MELSDVIIGSKLMEIQKKQAGIILIFRDNKTDSLYTLSFKGLLFETSAPTLNKRVVDVQLNNRPGFRAISQLRNLNQDPDKFRQLFIQMESLNDDNKSELLGVFKTYQLKRLPPAVAGKPTVNKKTSVKKSFQKN